MTKFIAFAVDMSGTPEARYDLVADDADAAAQEARQYLDRHQTIEVWPTDHSRVARYRQEAGLVRRSRSTDVT